MTTEGKPGLKIITSWRILFLLAHASGQARLAYNKKPTEENKEKFLEAERRHQDYVAICLEADEMIGLEGLI